MKAYSYVRWSSAKQTQGDSLRRQTELARQYAQRHRLTLDETSRVDAGLSAFTGKNVLDGELGSFLRAIDEGVIQTPCFLLVEALDRITRAQINRALRLFLDIIERGVTIVTLQTDQKFSSETVNSDNGISLIIAITQLVAGHEDSKKRGQRVRAAWDHKREQQAKGVIASSKGPAWLRLSEDRKRWIVRERQANTIRKIFDLALDGWGAMRIASHLNQNRVPTLSHAEFWTHGNVGALLQQEAVFGRFKQTHGDLVVDNYYPIIIDKATFDAVQEGRIGRRGKGGAHQDSSNLFAGMCFCAYCGSRTRYSVSGTKSNRTPYLRCLKSTNKGGCKARGIPYAILEKGLLDHLGPFAKLYDPGDSQAERSSQITAMEEQLKALNEKMEALVELSVTVPDVRAVGVKLRQLQNEVDSVEAKIKDAKAGIIRPDATMAFVEVLDALSENPNDNMLRSRARAALRSHFSRIEIAPHIHENIGFDIQVKHIMRREDATHAAIFRYINGHSWALELASDN